MIDIKYYTTKSDLEKIYSNLLDDAAYYEIITDEDGTNARRKPVLFLYDNGIYFNSSTAGICERNIDNLKAIIENMFDTTAANFQQHYEIDPCFNKEQNIDNKKINILEDYRIK